MTLNYILIIPIALVALVLIGWLIWKNSRDEKKFEKDTIDSEKKPEKHEEEHI